MPEVEQGDGVEDFIKTTVPMIMLLSVLALGVWIASLYSQIRILRYCYINLSDWTADHLEEICYQVRGQLYDRESLRGREMTDAELDNVMLDSVQNWKMAWEKEVGSHFATMRRNKVRVPTIDDKYGNRFPLGRWRRNRHDVAD